MTTIVKFLNARLDEDEEVAIVAARGAAYQTGDEAPEWSLRSPSALWSAPHGHAFGNVSPMAIRAATHIARHDPARVLREVEAKRAIVAQHEGVHECPSPRPWSLDGNTDHVTQEECWTLRNLASVYAEHPEYDPAWSVAT